MKYFTYILKSKINNDIYVGSTADVYRRIALHNDGRIKSTKAYKPWILLELTESDSRSAAVKLERFLKTGQQKEILRRKYGGVAKW